MEKYSKVLINECGSSKEVIKGSCGWGIENIYMDKSHIGLKDEKEF